MPKILILEDDLDTREEMLEFFKNEGFEAYDSPNVKAFEVALLFHKPDLVTLDINLPDGDGFSVTAFVRENSAAGIIIISGRGETIDKVVGLEVGADDYITKPYAPRELLARVRAQLRRMQRMKVSAELGDSFFLHFPGWIINERSRTVTTTNMAKVDFTTSEYDLLLTLVQNSQRVMTRETLMNHVKNNRLWANDERAIDGLVSKLRKRIGENTIQTIHNVGYMFTPFVHRSQDPLPPPE